MQIFWARIAAWLAAALTGVFGGWEVFLAGGFLTFLGVALYGLFLYGVNDILTYLLSQLQSINAPASAPGAISFTGFAGWFFTMFQVPACLAFTIDIIVLKFIMRKIPLIKW